MGAHPWGPGEEGTKVDTNLLEESGMDSDSTGPSHALFSWSTVMNFYLITGLKALQGACRDKHFFYFFIQL